MSNQACLFAEDTPDPCNPEVDGPGTRTFFIAGCAYQVPVFWLFCFDHDDLKDVELEDGQVMPTFVADITTVRQRLADRDRLARDLFPQQTAIWDEFRQAVESVDLPYLKADLCEIWCLYSHEDALGANLYEALEWFQDGSESAQNQLIGLSGLETYDYKTRTFTWEEGKDCPERYLYGWLEMFDPQKRR